MWFGQKLNYLSTAQLVYLLGIMLAIGCAAPNAKTEPVNRGQKPMLPTCKNISDLSANDGKTISIVGNYRVIDIGPHKMIMEQPDGSYISSNKIIHIKLVDGTTVELGIRPQAEMDALSNKRVTATGKLLLKPARQPDHVAQPDRIPTLLKVRSIVKSSNSDDLLKKFETIIPESWEITITDKKVTIKRKEPVWVLFENQINAPVNWETEKERIDRIKKNGKKTFSQLVYAIEEKWSDEKTDDVKEKNAAIEKQIMELQGKHKIVHLFDEALSRKGEDFYIAKKEEDKKRIEKYHKEKQRLKKELIKFPGFHFDNYSFFLVEKNGERDAFHRVHPGTASVEMMEIENNIKTGAVKMK